MLQYFRNKLSTAQLKARYEKMVHERLVELTEVKAPQPVSEDPGEWTLVGGGKNFDSEPERSATRDDVRKLIRSNPHACNILRLLESYVTGPGLKLTHQPIDTLEVDQMDDQLLKQANQLWKQFCDHNFSHYSFREHARRTWRDGECFVRKFSDSAWPPSLRFVDPESISATTNDPSSQGILTEPHDVETPVEYLRHLSHDNQIVERIPASQMTQTRIGVDSNEKRGVSLFAPLVEPLKCFSRWLDTELLARKLQSSIVLWRKVQGSPQMAENFADQAGTTGVGGSRREKFAPGTVLTTNHGTDIQFLQPNTNFTDAVSLGRMLLLSVAAGAGLPEFMLTSDASNANFASTMVAEGPAVKFFQSQQEFFAAEFTKLWKWVMQEAIEQGRLPEDFFDRIDIKWSFPPLINRDRPRERLADARLVESGILSRAEVARRDGVDPAAMKRERNDEDRNNSRSSPT
ncbi:MAG: phage portal protein [Planctomicrobium sp.]|jgi:capsid protein|nr:phage portal protein [Planctomicrobium sp.]